MSRSLGAIEFTDREEKQIEWVDRLDWLPVGQTIRYALAGNPVIMENNRAGRIITLNAELPWCRLSAATVDALFALAMVPLQNLAFVYDDFNTTVRFNRSAGPLSFVPIDPRRLYYTGSISLIQVT